MKIRVLRWGIGFHLGGATQVILEHRYHV